MRSTGLARALSRLLIEIMKERARARARSSLPISVHDARCSLESEPLRANRAIFNIGECRTATEFEALPRRLLAPPCAR